MLRPFAKVALFNMAWLANGNVVSPPNQFAWKDFFLFRDFHYVSPRSDKAFHHQNMLDASSPLGIHCSKTLLLCDSSLYLLKFLLDPLRSITIFGMEMNLDIGRLMLVFGSALLFSLNFIPFPSIAPHELRFVDHFPLSPPFLH
jgi:hypothetical protein